MAPNHRARRRLRASLTGKVADLREVQIVNGLQTTESIFRHFRADVTVNDDRALLVKIIVSTDPAIRDQIIRATNNQSVVESSSLRATDRVQRDIEEILERNDWYYERRKNYYRNIGKPASRFVTPIFVATAYVTLVRKHPTNAAKLKPKFMRYDETYRKVFSESINILIWPVLVNIVKFVEGELLALRSGQSRAREERFLATWRNVVSLIAVSKILSTFAYSIASLAAINRTLIDRALITEIWGLVDAVRTTNKSGSLIRRVCEAAAEKYGIAGLETLGKQDSVHNRVHDAASKALREEAMMDEGFLSSVARLLPNGPVTAEAVREAALSLRSSRKAIQRARRVLARRALRAKERGPSATMPVESSAAPSVTNQES